MSNLAANVMCTRNHVIRITQKDGLFDEVIGLSFGEIKERFTESKFYQAYLSGMTSDTNELIDAFMEQELPGEYDPQEYTDLRYWIRHAI